MTRARPFSTLLTVTVSAMAFVFVIVGVLFFIQGFQGYISREPNESSFGNLLLAVAFISFPLFVFFFIRALRSKDTLAGEYSRPSYSQHFMLYIILGTVFFIAAASAVVIFAVFLRP